ncbi:DUF2963 domain-containing protein ['Fragaria x ananassa' phyllody phytoplasma]|uniref:DUF2963 domain-containing protein n=2 Tax='Fragaria x ananassa' phyllody phytoplasma TaxID=2358428 RepID=A0ABS5K332_9MOLU|nr:DUF2963 domain-containing protein ['Fragaria x ananassa' phyllody phytoplasma]
MAKADKEIDVLTTTKNVIFQPGTKIIRKIEFLNSQGDKFKEIIYQDDGKTIEYINEYDKDTENLIKSTRYQDDEKTIEYINEYDKDTENLIKLTYYQDDGKTIKYIEEYDKHTGKIIKATEYSVDGKILNIFEYSPTKELKKTYDNILNENNKKSDRIEGGRKKG